MRILGRAREPARDRGLDRARARARASVAPGPLAAFLDTEPPDPQTPLARLPLLALDVETTGLDPRGDHILAMGFVPVDGGVVRLEGCEHLVVRAPVEVGRSATIHGLTDDVVAGGVALEVAVRRVLDALAGRVLLSHHAGIETGFLGAACQRIWGAGMPCAVVDTMRLAERLFPRRIDEEIPSGALRLWAARSRYGLPVGKAHHALADAIACAELYLAQVAELEDAARSAGRPPLVLRDLA